MKGWPAKSSCRVMIQFFLTRGLRPFESPQGPQAQAPFTPVKAKVPEPVEGPFRVSLSSFYASKL